MRHQNINTVFRITDGFDFCIEAIFRSIEELEDFKENLEDRFDIAESRSYFIVEKIKKEQFLSRPELPELLDSE